MEGFGIIERERILNEDDLWIVVKDRYPVSPGHTLVIAKRVVARFADLTKEEKERLVM